MQFFINELHTKKNINEVLKYILKSKENVFLVTGSLYLVGKIRKKFL